MRILLVDDSLALLHENQRALERAGYLVVCAEDGETALRLAGEQLFDVILLDLLLPRVSGTDVLKTLKNDPATAEIPVVIVSSLCEKNRERLIAAGAEDYLEKSALMPRHGKNLLPKALEDIVCRIRRKRGVQFVDLAAKP